MAEKLRYRPNHAARSLAMGRTNLIAYWSPGFQSSYSNDKTHTMHQLLKGYGYETITSMLSPDGKPFGDSAITRWKVDGIVIDGMGKALEHYPQLYPFQKTPTVRIESRSDIDLSIDVVLIGLYEPSRQAVQLLLNSGRKRVAHMLVDSTEAGEDRWRAYEDAMREAGRKMEFIRIPNGTFNDARLMVKRYVREYDCPDAIFCANDEMAIGTYRGLRDLGMNIPDDVALVGCDGIRETEYMDKPITTIVQPIELSCEQAWRLLRQRMEQPDAPIRKVEIKGQLVIRESSGTGSIQQRKEV
jgi:LacI family transcriptional regulator